MCDFTLLPGMSGDRPICPSSVKEIRGGAEGGGYRKFLSLCAGILRSRSMDDNGCVRRWYFDMLKPRTSLPSRMNTETRASPSTDHPHYCIT